MFITSPIGASGGGGGGGGPPTGAAGGNLSGTYPNPTVAKINGASVPAAGALTTGNAPYVSGASALTYSALNLAGGAGWVTGVLPKANQGAQDMAGDVTGNTGAAVVAKVNGATVPAAGALTTGNAPYVSGVSALTYSALNLAGGSGWVTGVLPKANQEAQDVGGDLTGTTASAVVAKLNGATTVAAGALTTNHILKVSGVSATTYGYLVDANVDAAAAIAGSKVNPDFAAQSVITTGTYTCGASPSTTGDFRFKNAHTIRARNGAGSADLILWELTSSNRLSIGSGDGQGSPVTNMQIYPSSSLNMGIGSTTLTQMTSSGFGAYQNRNLLVYGAQSSAPPAGGGTGIIVIGNCNAAPSGATTNTGQLYVESGALKYKGASGTITTLAVT